MPIQTSSPLVIPERTFDKLWVSGIDIFAPSPLEECVAVVTMIPCNSSGNTSEENKVRISIRDIIAKSQDKTSNIAKAMYFLLKAIEDEYKLQNQPVEEQL